MVIIKIAVRGGHTRKSIGAKALIDEVTEDRKVKDAVIKYLKALGHNVLDVTPNDNMAYPAELNYGIKKANDWGAELFVSVHFNNAYSSYNGAIGSEVCVYNTHDYAKRVCSNLEGLGFKNRGQKLRNNLAELTNTNMKSMIIEVCFVEATKDVEIYKKHGADKVGRVIAEAISNKKVTVESNNKVLYRVQLGAFSSTENAEKLKKELENKGYKPIIVKG